MEIQEQINALRQMRENILSQGRDFAKPLNTALLHGGGSRAMSSSLNTYELDQKQVQANCVNALEEAYGPEWIIPNQIAKLGTNIHAKGHSIIEWTMPDGFTATSVGYTEDTAVECITVIDGKKHKAIVNCKMPVLAVGGQILDAHVNTSPHKLTSTKVYGLYANCIHAIDSYLMRQTYLRCGFKFTDILDKWKLQPSNIETLFTIQQEILDETQYLFQEILDSITTKYNVPPYILPKGNCKIEATNTWLAS